MSVLKDESIIVFKTNTPKQTVIGRGEKLSKLRKEKIKKPFVREGNKEKIKDRTIRDIWKLFESDEKTEERKSKGHDKRIVEDN